MLGCSPNLGQPNHLPRASHSNTHPTKPVVAKRWGRVKEKVEWERDGSRKKKQWPGSENQGCQVSADKPWTNRGRTVHRPETDRVQTVDGAKKKEPEPEKPMVRDNIYSRGGRRFRETSRSSRTLNWISCGKKKRVDFSQSYLIFYGPKNRNIWWFLAFKKGKMFRISRRIDLWGP